MSEAHRGEWRIGVWFMESGPSERTNHQSWVELAGVVDGKPVVLRVPNTFGEGQTLSAAVKATLRSLSKSIGENK